MTNTNRLLEKSQHKYSATPFDKIQNSDFLPALKIAIEESTENIETIKNNPEAANFQNTIVALENASQKISHVLKIYYALFSAHSNEELQKMSTDISSQSTAFSNYVNLDKILFQKIKTVYDQKQLLTNQEDLKLLENTYISFVRNGANLSEPDKDKIKKIDQELSSLSPQFSKNLLADSNAYSLHITDPKDTEGLPSSLLNLSRQMAKDKKLEGWLFNLQFPSFLPFVQFCKNRKLREDIYKAMKGRALNGPNCNKELVKKIAHLRLKRAQLLGFKSHAEYVLKERMAQDVSRVKALYDQLYQPSKEFALSELSEVKKIALETDGLEEIMPWDNLYYSEILKQKTLNFDSENLRPYFEVDRTVQGVFNVASQLYDIEFKQASYPVFHKDVKTYEVYDKKNNEFVGLFYVDLFPRESKRAGAWATEIKDQSFVDGQPQRPHAMIVCNFSPSTDSAPSLLSFEEVETLFHEFGHALHMLLSKCKYQSLSGANVYWDFVELPSQIMENWALEKECLDLFAKHYQTNEDLPDSYLQAIKKANQFQSGTACLRQLSLGALDLAWHTLEAETELGVEDFERQALEPYVLTPYIEGTNTSVSFGHLFAGGYSAGYYSYKWAEILDADAFELFKEKGIFNKEVAQKFKTEILEKGGSAHPMTLYKNFRGREPKPEALLRREGFA